MSDMLWAVFLTSDFVGRPLERRWSSMRFGTITCDFLPFACVISAIWMFDLGIFPEDFAGAFGTFRLVICIPLGFLLIHQSSGCIFASQILLMMVGKRSTAEARADAPYTSPGEKREGR